MKKILALFLALVAVLANAFPTPLYRWKFNPDPSSCIDGVWEYIPNGGTAQYELNTSGPVVLKDGDMMDIGIRSSCCNPNTDTYVGWKWEEVSYDNGSTWTILTPSYTQLMLPVGVSDELFKNNTSTGPVPYNAETSCF